MKKRGIIIGIVVAVIVITVVAILLISSSKSYENKVEGFLDALISEKVMKEEMQDIFDYKGVYAWHVAEGSAKDFDEAYSKQKLDGETKKDLEEDLIDLASENEDYDSEVEILEIEKAKKNKDNNNLSTVTVIIKAKNTHSSWQKAELLFTFYNGKIIDVSLVDEDNYLYSAFEFATETIENTTVEEKDPVEENEKHNNAQTVSALKLTGYYVYKDADAWYAMAFREGGNAQYIINPCPGDACGGFLDEGTFTIEGSKVIVTLTTTYADIEIVEINPPDVREFNLIDENSIERNGLTMVYQEEFN